MARPSACLVAGLLALAACGGGHSAPSITARASEPGGCPVSTAAGPPPPQRALQNFGTPMAKASDPGWYGNGVLWTQLRADTSFIPAPGGKLTLKMPWFRAARGPVTIEGRPLSGPPAPFSASVNAADYGAVRLRAGRARVRATGVLVTTRASRGPRTAGRARRSSKHPPVRIDTTAASGGATERGKVVVRTTILDRPDRLMRRRVRSRPICVRDRTRVPEWRQCKAELRVRRC